MNTRSSSCALVFLAALQIITPASNAQTPEVKEKIKAVERTTNQSAIARIAQSDPIQMVRVAAVKKLQNQRILASIALKDTNAFVRESAIGRITDSKLLKSIVESKGPWHLRGEQIFSGIFSSIAERKLRELALSRIADKVYLFNLVRKSPISDLRIIALQTLAKDTTMLAEFLSTSDSILCQMKPWELEHSRLLLECAMRCKDVDLAGGALGALSGIAAPYSMHPQKWSYQTSDLQRDLESLARRAATAEVRAWAASKLDSVELAIDIVKGNSDSRVLQIWNNLPLEICGQFPKDQHYPKQFARVRVLFVPIQEGGEILKYRDGRLENWSSDIKKEESAWTFVLKVEKAELMKYDAFTVMFESTPTEYWRESKLWRLGGAQDQGSVRFKTDSSTNRLDLGNIQIVGY